MADLKSLIRVRKHTVEQKQKVVAALYEEATKLENEKNAMLTTLAEEEAKSADMPLEMLSYIGPYREAVQLRVAAIGIVAKNLEARIQIAQDDMRQAFSELKKVEITQEKREDEEKAELDKKESNELDDIAIEAFLRRQKEEEGA
jgi:flagellar FliJ protein